MQPMFDGLWGGPGGMYEQRLGAERAAGMNRFADLVSAGVLVAFGSDAPVTDLGPWAAVRAAVHPTNPGQALSTRAAFGAHTRSGWRAVGRPDAGRGGHEGRIRPEGADRKLGLRSEQVSGNAIRHANPTKSQVDITI
jgi:predicted amidohydrolase YtcJ